MTPPVPSIATVTIHDVAFGGAGVGRLEDGCVVFIPQTIAGEKVKVEIHKKKRAFAEGRALEIIEPSPQRVEPPCPWFGECGGCQYQHIDYPEQVRIKTNQVRETLRRIGGFPNPPEIAVHSSSNPFGYRNKITLHRGINNEFGYHGVQPREIVDIDRCLLASDDINQQIIEWRTRPKPPEHLNLFDREKRDPKDKEGFQQVNSTMASHLLEYAINRLKNRTEAHLLDLYCGSGFFTLPLSAAFKSVRGLDTDERAIHVATRKAGEMKLQNTSFYLGKAEERTPWLLEQFPHDDTVILLDPPREGLDKAVVGSLAQSKVKNLLYVSCNPATLARDLKILCGSRNRQLHSLAIFDMFPQTAHIETVAEITIC